MSHEPQPQDGVITSYKDEPARTATAAGVTSPFSLYDPQLASFSMEGYDVTAARGFIDLFGLPMKVASQVRRW